MSEISAAKARLRRQIGGQRTRVPSDTGRRAGEAAARHLLADPSLPRARCVALYASLHDEISTRPLFDALADGGVARLFPRMTRDGRLEFVRIERWDDLRPGRYGVLEPAPDAAAAAPVGGDWVVVPGVAFDTAGGRLGRGGGYYDRSFPTDQEGAPLLIGFAYSFQVVPEVPAAPEDRRMDVVVTEDGIVLRPPERA